MSSEPHLKSLKRLVISMGILLIVGFFITIVGAWMKFRAPAPETSGQCKDLTLDFKGKGSLKETDIEHDVVTFLLSGKDGRQIIVRVDACSGKQLNQLTIQK